MNNQNPTHEALLARLNQLYKTYTALRLNATSPSPEIESHYAQTRREIALLAQNKKENFGPLLAAYQTLLRLEHQHPALVKIFAQADDAKTLQIIRQNINNKIAELRAAQSAKPKTKNLEIITQKYI